MPKWSQYILNLGTAGPNTLQGIKNLGFALTSEIPGLVAKYVRVDAAQTFTSGEQLQGRSNIGLGTISTQDADDVAITGGEITGIVDLAVADGGTGASSAPAARTNLGLGNVDNTSDADKPISTSTQTALDLKAPLASPALTGTPTAPTAAPGTNTTQVSTTAFVAAAVGDWEPIAKTTVSGTPASLDYTGLSAFRKIRISGFLKPTTDAVTLGVQTSSNNGSSYDSGASDYAGEYTHAASSTQTATSTSTAQIFITYNATVGNAANEGIRFDVEIDEFNQSAFCYLSTNSFWINETGNVNKASNGARRLSATARDAFRLIFGAGTVASGFVTVEGVRG